MTVFFQMLSRTSPCQSPWYWCERGWHICSLLAQAEQRAVRTLPRRNVWASVLNAVIFYSCAMARGWKPRAETGDDEHWAHAPMPYMWVLTKGALILFQKGGHTGSCDKWTKKKCLLPVILLTFLLVRLPATPAAWAPRLYPNRWTLSRG